MRVASMEPRVIESYCGSISKTHPEGRVRPHFNPVKLYLQPGDAYFRDNRTFHRGTPVVEGRCRRIHSIVTPTTTPKLWTAFAPFHSPYE